MALSANGVAVILGTMCESRPSTFLQIVVGQQILVGGLSALAIVAVVSETQAQEHEQRAAISAYGLVGLAGEVDTTITTTAGGRSTSADGETDLNPTLGFGLRAEFPALLPWLVVGALVEFGWIAPDAVAWLMMAGDDERYLAVDLDGWIKGRHVIELGDLALELYVGVPLGLTIGEEYNEALDAGFGFNLGVLAGAQLLLLDRLLGVFVDAGWRFHQVFYSETVTTLVGQTDISQRVSWHQFAVNFGASLGF